MRTERSIPEIALHISTGSANLDIHKPWTLLSPTAATNVAVQKTLAIRSAIVDGIPEGATITVGASEHFAFNLHQDIAWWGYKAGQMPVSLDLPTPETTATLLFKKIPNDIRRFNSERYHYHRKKTLHPEESEPSPAPPPLFKDAGTIYEQEKPEEDQEHVRPPLMDRLKASLRAALLTKMEDAKTAVFDVGWRLMNKSTWKAVKKNLDQFYLFADQRQLHPLMRMSYDALEDRKTGWGWKFFEYLSDKRTEYLQLQKNHFHTKAEFMAFAEALPRPKIAIELHARTQTPLDFYVDIIELRQKYKNVLDIGIDFDPAHILEANVYHQQRSTVELNPTQCFEIWLKQGLIYALSIDQYRENNSHSHNAPTQGSVDFPQLAKLQGEALAENPNLPYPLWIIETNPLVTDIFLQKEGKQFMKDMVANFTKGFLDPRSNV